MAAQYDSIAEQYRRSKESPLRRYVESWSFFELIGDVSGKSILDLGCGEGFYTRELRMRGAARVTGVDISPAMIDLAQQQERHRPLGVEYLCADVKQMPDLGRFDMVVAAYLLHYSETVSELTTMCEQIRRHLEPGGRFVTLNENPDQSPACYSGYEQYGFGKTVELPRREGSTIGYWMISGREVFRFNVYHFERSTYERVLVSAGFGGIEWSPPGVDPDPDPAVIEQVGEGYWQGYLQNPPVTGLVCRAC